MRAARWTVKVWRCFVLDYMLFMFIDLFGVCCRSRAVLVSTLAGSGAAESSDGIGTQASFKSPDGVATSRSGTFAVASDSGGHRICFIDLASSQVMSMAGSGMNMFADGQGTQASFSVPQGVAISPDDSFVLVVEGFQSTSNRVRHIVIATGVVTTLAGDGAGYADGVGTMAKFNQPGGVAVSPDGSYALITDRFNFRVRRLDISSKTVTTIAGSTSGFGDGKGTNAAFGLMSQLAIDPTGSYALICDHGSIRIRRLDLASSQVTTLAGFGASGFQDGMGTNAVFNGPFGVSIDPTGTFALLVEYMNHRIRRIDIATAQVTTMAGTGAVSVVNGLGAQATFNGPRSISIDFNGTFALVVDADNNRIRRIALTSASCTAGYYCPLASSSPTQNACQAGQFCPPGAAAATACPVASFCASTGISAPTVCTMGLFCNATGMSAAVPCPAGSFCSSASSIASCAAGYYCANSSFNMWGAVLGQSAFRLQLCARFCFFLLS
jgi:DNA-binding beta-propeller fold protein YncE